MHPVNVLEAKNQLSRLLEQVESGAESEVVIARHGRPVARLVPLVDQPVERRIGVARGRFEVPESIDEHNDEIAALFGVPPVSGSVRSCVCYSIPTSRFGPSPIAQRCLPARGN